MTELSGDFPPMVNRMEKETSPSHHVSLYHPMLGQHVINNPGNIHPPQCHLERLLLQLVGFYG